MKWFKTQIDTPSELLCDKNSKQVAFENLIGEIKKAGLYDVEKKCIASVDANRKYHTVCERNCTQFNCLKLKSKLKQERKVVKNFKFIIKKKPFIYNVY